MFAVAEQTRAPAEEGKAAVGNELSARPGRVDRGGQPRLSVIVPALDEAAHIGITLRDLDGCRIPTTEVLVVDGGSTDATREIAEPLCDRVIEAPRGRACQMNVGAD